MTKEPDKPVSMSKSAPGGEPAASRPWTATAATAAIAVSGVAALAGSLVLLGERKWLTDTAVKDNVKTVTSAIASASSSAAKNHADVSSAVASVSASATSAYPTTASGVHHTVSQQQSGSVIMSVVLVLAMSFLAFGVYRGRHWSRWGVSIFWALATLTGTFAGLTFLFAVSSSLPFGVKAMTFISAAGLLVAVVLVNLRMSTEWFALSRPARAAGAPPQRRSLFFPRMPDATGTQRPASRSASRTASPQPSADQTDRADAAAQKQRAKKRATANAESVARGAELARNRAKAASKSRRTES